VPHQQLERLARYTPALILAYFTIQFLIRVGFSGNLETDEAEFVGRTYLALGYGNSHPPLYNWLVRGALELTGGHWACAVALVKGVLLGGTYLLSFDLARRVTGRSLPGLIVVASFMLLPQVVWKSQITLAHSVLLMFAVVGTLHAVVLIAQRGDLRSFLWLGTAAAIGALAKYNFLVMLMAILLAAFTVPYLRARLLSAKLFLSLAVFLLLVSPHLIWALHHIEESTKRIAKLDRTDKMFGIVDVPFIGLDGFLTLVGAVIAWAAPLLLAWFAIRRFAGPSETDAQRSVDTPATPFGDFFGRSVLIGVGAFAAIILVFDFHAVHERYLTPMLMPLPFWLALRWPMDVAPRAPVQFLRLAGAIALLMMTAWPLWIAFGREQLAYPYASFASALPRTEGVPLALLSDQEKYAANLAIRLSDAGIFGEIERPGEIAVLWRQKSDRVPDNLAARLGATYRPRGEVIQMSFPYENFSGKAAQMNAQIYVLMP
jgi:4-amino-4-deoxy-L-arabinose transferase-like glycosyltransferase